MLSVVTWYWKTPGYRSQFTADHVNTLKAMVERHYAKPFTFICVTDFPSGIDTGITIVPDWKDFTAIRSPHGGGNPSCYRRLRAFHPMIGKVFGPRFVSLDLDTVITGDLVPLWDRPEDFVAWGETNPKSHYNGSMFLLTAGSRSKVWTEFHPQFSPQKAKAAGKFGSDQGWISYCLGGGEARWTTADGVYSYNVHLRGKTTTLPKNARVVMFHGGTDPDSVEAQKLEWVRRHYQPAVSHRVEAHA